jgi:hypothetical protein
MSAEAQVTASCLANSACNASEPHITSASSEWPERFIASSIGPLICFIWSSIEPICAWYELSAAWQACVVDMFPVEAR